MMIKVNLISSDDSITNREGCNNNNNDSNNSSSNRSSYQNRSDIMIPNHTTSLYVTSYDDNNINNDNDTINNKTYHDDDSHVVKLSSNLTSSELMWCTEQSSLLHYNQHNNNSNDRNYNGSIKNKMSLLLHHSSPNQRNDDEEKPLLHRIQRYIFKKYSFIILVVVFIVVVGMMMITFDTNYTSYLNVPEATTQELFPGLSKLSLWSQGNKMLKEQYTTLLGKKKDKKKKQHYIVVDDDILLDDDKVLPNEDRTSNKMYTKHEYKLEKKEMKKEKEDKKKKEKHDKEEAKKEVEKEKEKAKKQAEIEKEMAKKEAEKAKQKGKKEAEIEKENAKKEKELEKKEAEIEKENAKKEAEKEKGNAKKEAGIEKGKAKKEAGTEKAQAKKEAGIEKGFEKKEAGMEKYLNKINHLQTIVPSYINSDEDTTISIQREMMTLITTDDNDSDDDDSNDDSNYSNDGKKLLSLQMNNGLQLITGYPSEAVQIQYYNDLQNINWMDVKSDLIDLMTTSTSHWPADYGNYGPFFIRLAWHSCGSYRTSDGRGGCDGGGQRFDPERSWPDNTNLDKARQLLQPIKLKYGNGLSWGDLFAYTGTIAIEMMGYNDNIGFCAGRLDYIDNTQTIQLGPSDIQDQFGHCEVNGQCPFPLGSNTIGLIYVNPEGPMGIPDPVGAAETIRDVFGRMGWHGRELVALIGGGHTFGKAHGASTESNGVPPKQCPFASWNGPNGVNTITSGIEGSWTTKPTKWDNEYFYNLIHYEWEVVKGPGGHWQYQVKEDGPMAPIVDPNSDEKQNIIMLTTDIALKVDPEYRKYVEEFAMNQSALDEAFGKAWYTLVTRDIGPVTRCAGNPPRGQKFQHDLPEPPKDIANMDDVQIDLHQLMNVTNMDNEFIRLAYQCASTFRATDYRGGCNGGRIRFSPGIDWPINVGLNETILLLEPIKLKYGNTLSYADLFVLAGNVALERLDGIPKLSFCPGRTDDIDGSAWKSIEYGITDHPKSFNVMIELLNRRGQSYKDLIALTFPRFQSTTQLMNVLLLSEVSNETESLLSYDDLLIDAIRYIPELRYWAEHIASSTDIYAAIFAESWTRLMNADRFDGPIGNVCG